MIKHLRYSDADLRLQDARILLFRAELALMRKPDRFEPETDAARLLLHSRDRLIAAQQDHATVFVSPGQ